MANYPNRRKTAGIERIQALENTDLDLPKLTLKQERFVKHLLAGKSAREAYRLAYDCSGMAETSIAVEACRLAQNAKIARSIRIRQRIGLEEAAITKDSHLSELARLREIAVENQQVSAGVQAEVARGRVAGLYNDKLQLQIGPSDDMLLSQIASLLGEQTAKTLASAMGYEESETIELGVTEDSAFLKLPSPVEKD
jgi:hypothetical protein